MTWQPGRERVQHLVAAGELETVTQNAAVAARLVADAGKHLDTAATGLASEDFAGAYQRAYDALRKSAAALLAYEARTTSSEQRRGPATLRSPCWTKAY